jgi:hypothetical protein
MYQYNDCLTQLFTKYKYIWLWLQCFDPYLGHRQAYIMNLESVVHVLRLLQFLQRSEVQDAIYKESQKIRFPILLPPNNFT